MASKELKLSALKEFVGMFKNSKTYSSNKKVLHILIFYIRKGKIQLFIEKIKERSPKGSVKWVRRNNRVVSPKESKTCVRD